MEGPFQLSTHRLILRPHEDLDAEFMVALNSDPAVTRFTVAPAPVPAVIATASPAEPLLDIAQALALIENLRRQFRERRMGRFIVLHRSTRERLGWCGLKPIEADPRAADLGYRFMRRWWGQGFATEAAEACVRHGFEELGLRTISAEVEAGNERSMRVLGKLGFHPTAGATLWVLEKP